MRSADHDLWVQFASAALTGLTASDSQASFSTESATAMAAEHADAMLAEWDKRFGLEEGKK